MCVFMALSVLGSPARHRRCPQTPTFAIHSPLSLYREQFDAGLDVRVRTCLSHYHSMLFPVLMFRQNGSTWQSIFNWVTTNKHPETTINSTDPCPQAHRCSSYKRGTREGSLIKSETYKTHTWRCFSNHTKCKQIANYCNTKIHRV